MRRTARGWAALFATALALAACASESKVFHVDPLRRAAELRTESLAVTLRVLRGDFHPSDLVELVTLDPTIHLDIRYATNRNLLGEPPARKTSR